MRGTTVLLTGGTGFVGGHVAAALAAAGAHVVCLVRPASRHGPLAERGAELRFGSLDDGAEVLRRVCEGCRLIIHVAGATRVRREADFLRVNRDGTRRLVEAAAMVNEPPRLLLVSSLAACGPSRAGAPLVEADPPAPVSAYGESKLAGEKVVRDSGLPWVIVRPPVVYGPGDRDVLTFFKLASYRLAPRIGAADRQVSMIHVQDLAEGLIRAAGAPAGSTYFMGDPEPYRWDEVTRAIAAAVGSRPASFRVPFWAVRAAAWTSEKVGRALGRAVIFNRDKVREMRHACWTCRSDKAAAELGFVPSFGVRDGMEQTAAWYREAGWL